MQFDLRKFIATGRQPYHAEFQCDLSAHDYAGARIPEPVTAVFNAETDGEEIRMTLRANASVHGECARSVIRTSSPSVSASKTTVTGCGILAPA